MKEIDWIIHAVANGVYCPTSGTIEDGFVENACNFHTHGMEQYGHLNFQVVLELPAEDIGYILNTLGQRVQAGEYFEDGQYVSGIFEDCDIRLKLFEETGRQVLRVIIPDNNNIFPDDDRCMDVFKLQLLPTDMLYCTGGFLS